MFNKVFLRIHQIFQLFNSENSLFLHKSNKHDSIIKEFIILGKRLSIYEINSFSSEKLFVP